MEKGLLYDSSVLEAFEEFYTIASKSHVCALQSERGKLKFVSRSFKSSEFGDGGQTVRLDFFGADLLDRVMILFFVFLWFAI